MFNKCDKFNRRLCHCTWPHKMGGRDVLGVMHAGFRRIVSIFRVLNLVLITSRFQTKFINLMKMLTVEKHF